jgi:hypothetical protein
MALEDGCRPSARRLKCENSLQPNRGVLMHRREWMQSEMNRGWSIGSELDEAADNQQNSASPP